MAITSRGRAWEWKQSWWAVLLPFGLLAAFSFIAMGLRVRRRAWTVTGVVYAVAGMALLWLLSAGASATPGAPPTDLQMTATLAFTLLWIGSIVHAFMARPEYLIRLDAKEKASDPYAALRSEAAAEFVRPAPPAPAKQAAPAAQSNRKPAPKPQQAPAPKPAAAAPPPAPATPPPTPAAQPEEPLPSWFDAPPPAPPPPESEPPPPPLPGQRGGRVVDF